MKREKPGEPITVLFSAGVYPMTDRSNSLLKTPGRPSANRLSSRTRAARPAERRSERWPVAAGGRSQCSPGRRKRRGHVRVADLAAQGITDYGTLTVRGFSVASQPAEAELFCDDRPMQLARWPNAGFRRVEASDSLQRVRVDTDRCALDGRGDPWVFAHWHHDGLNSANRSPRLMPTRGRSSDRRRSSWSTG